MKITDDLSITPIGGCGRFFAHVEQDGVKKIKFYCDEETRTHVKESRLTLVRMLDGNVLLINFKNGGYSSFTEKEFDDYEHADKLNNVVFDSLLDNEEEFRNAFLKQKTEVHYLDISDLVKKEKV